MEFDGSEDEGREDEGPRFAFLPPEDRLWRHPSEVVDDPAAPDVLTGSAPAQATTTLARPTVRVWTLALAAGLAGALFASGFFVATGVSDRRTTVLEPVVTPGTVSLESSAVDAPVRAGDWSAIFDVLASSVTAVRVSDEGNVQVGSGVVYAAGHDETYVLTAADLVAEGGSVTVAFGTGESQKATVVGTDAATGIALLATTGNRRTLPVFGTVSDVEVAEQVLAIGTRLSNSSSVVTGTVSGLDQEVATGSGDGTTMVGMLALSGMTMPQAGDGGPLVDPDGKVVGIDTEVSSTDPSAQGVAYAVPIDVAEHSARQLLAARTPTHPWLGVDEATDVAGLAAQQLGVPGGAMVGTVDPQSPATESGLRTDDVITAFDGQAVDSSGDLVRILSQCAPGQRTTITYFHRSTKVSVALTVDERPSGA